jgi:lipocalin
MGTWYELVHYPSWFQRNDNYNTMAQYELMSDGSVKVHNSTITQGKCFDSYGIAQRLGDLSFRVDFPISEVNKLIQSQQFNPPQIMNTSMAQYTMMPNYVIDKIVVNNCGEYIFAIVTDPSKQSLYVLSRNKHPDLATYNFIMNYVVTNYERDRLVQTPHFD